MKPEDRAKNGVKALLKKHSVWHFKPNINGMGVNGIPDFICCVKGRMLAIETKGAGKKPTPLQQTKIDGINEAGGVAIVVTEDRLESLEKIILVMQLSPSLGVKHAQ